MSLVGPRPETLEKATTFNKEEGKRHYVLPGITGYWQLSPYRHLDIKNHLEYDFGYIREMSLFVDLAVILATPILMSSQKEWGPSQKSIRRTG
jgi:lipopolysaccharide/colanic/teichoic acid biosynthesis glycosyltransferase